MFKIELNIKQSDLFSLLLESPDHIASFDEILKTLWPDKKDLDEARAVEAVSQLRRKFRDTGLSHVIKSSYGKRAYQLKLDHPLPHPPTSS